MGKNFDITKLSGEDSITLFDLPREYEIVNEHDSIIQYHYDGSLQNALRYLFQKHPEVKSLAFLPGQYGIRSVYATKDEIHHDDARENFNDKQKLYHIEGEKLVKLDAHVSCDLTATGVVKVMVPQHSEEEEAKKIIHNKVASMGVNINFSENFETQDGLYIDVVTKGFNEIFESIPVEFTPSLLGTDIKYLLESSERGDEIPAEVFMYLSAQKNFEAGGKLNDKFMSDLQSKAWKASEEALMEHMLENKPLKNKLIVLKTGTDELVEYASGVLLTGTVKCPVEVKKELTPQENDDVIYAENFKDCHSSSQNQEETDSNDLIRNI